MIGGKTSAWKPITRPRPSKPQLPLSADSKPKIFVIGTGGVGIPPPVGPFRESSPPSGFRDSVSDEDTEAGRLGTTISKIVNVRVSGVPPSKNSISARPWRVPDMVMSHVPAGESNAAARLWKGSAAETRAAAAATPQRKYPLRDLFKANFVFMCLSTKVFFSVAVDYLADLLQSTGLPLSQADQSGSSVSDAGVGVLRKSDLVG